MSRERKRIFVVIKTQPSPSKSYREIVCTAGIDEDGNFVRLYPFPYRYMEAKERFKKYQWIEVEVDKPKDDPRPESFKAFPDSLRAQEEVKEWGERRKIIFRNNNLYTMCSLRNTKRTSISLAIIKPQDVKLQIIPHRRDWTEREQAILRQKYLFDTDRPVLKKVPYLFMYKYKCLEPNCKGHRQIIHDWEITAAYWNFLKKYGSEQNALNNIENKFYKEMCSGEKDLYFFVGKHSRHNAWLLIGIWYGPNLYPKKINGVDTLFKFL